MDKETKEEIGRWVHILANYGEALGTAKIIGWLKLLENLIEKTEAERDELLAALGKVVAISDRKHDAWDEAHALIAKHSKE